MTWVDFHTEIFEEIDRLFNDKINGCHTPLFRGLSSKSYKLLPSLFRNIDPSTDLKVSKSREMSVFFDFMTYSPIFHSNHPRDSWEVLSEMRHHEIPTRLLDWTGNFAVALYFALRKKFKPGEENAPCIWILNPIKLNEKSVDKKRIISIMPEQSLDYEKMFITNKITAFKNPIAISPVKSHPRVIAQNSFFTVHGNNLKPLDEIYGRDVIKRFDIPYDVIPDAKKFLKLSNMDEFSVFPDLDGLGRKMNKIYFSE